MSLLRLQEGLGILIPHYTHPEDVAVMTTFHNVVVLEETDTPLEREDIRRLIALGWYQAPRRGAEFTEEDYEPGWPWRCEVAS